MKAVCTLFISFFVAFNFAIHCYCERLNIMLISEIYEKPRKLISPPFLLMPSSSSPLWQSVESSVWWGGGSLLTGVLTPRLEGFVFTKDFFTIALIYIAENMGYTSKNQKQLILRLKIWTLLKARSWPLKGQEILFRTFWLNQLASIHSWRMVNKISLKLKRSRNIKKMITFSLL